MYVRISGWSALGADGAEMGVAVGKRAPGVPGVPGILLPLAPGRLMYRAPLADAIVGLSYGLLSAAACSSFLAGVGPAGKCVRTCALSNARRWSSDSPAADEGAT